VLDVDGTFLHTGAARRTCPESVRRNVVADELLVPYLLFGVGQLLAPFLLQDERRLVDRAFVDGHDDATRIQHLARLVGRAHARTTTAVRTRIAIEEGLPRKVLDVHDTELLHAFGFEVDLLHRIVRADMGEEDVRNRRQHMKVLGVR